MTRSQRLKDSKQPIIEIRAATVVVSMEKVEAYYRDEIANEGIMRKSSFPIILLPKADSGKAHSTWISKIFQQMRAVREQEHIKPISFSGGYNIDVGLIDLQVFFDGSQQDLTDVMSNNPHVLFNENLKHIDLLSQGTIHDQMILVSIPHSFAPFGSFCFHYHNVIFGIRKKGSLIGYLSVDDLLSQLSKGSKISLVA